jgi:glutamate--cysteine ligase
MTRRRSTPLWSSAADWTAEERDKLRYDAAEFGLRAEIRGRSMRDLARDCLAIARGGLARRAKSFVFDIDETHFLNALHDVVERGETLSDELLRRWREEWDGDLSRIYAEYSYWRSEPQR